MIRLCSYCSGIVEEKVREIIKDETLEVGCTGHCGKHEGKCFGYIGNEFVVVDEEEDFLEKVVQFVEGK